MLWQVHGLCPAGAVPLSPPLGGDARMAVGNRRGMVRPWGLAVVFVFANVRQSPKVYKVFRGILPFLHILWGWFAILRTQIICYCTALHLGNGLRLRRNARILPRNFQNPWWNFPILPRFSGTLPRQSFGAPPPGQAVRAMA